MVFKGVLLGLELVLKGQPILNTLEVVGSISQAEEGEIVIQFEEIAKVEVIQFTQSKGVERCGLTI